MNEEGNKTIVETAGIKIEVDPKSLVINNVFKVGAPVRVLAEPRYSGQQEICPGVILSFVQFPEGPKIEVVYIDHSKELQFAVVNIDNKDKSEKIQIAPVNEHQFSITKAQVISMLSEKVEKSKRALLIEEEKLSLFKKNFEYLKDN